MKYWEIDSDQYGHIRIEWNGYSNFNLQAPIIKRRPFCDPHIAEWVDFHCFTCYGIQSDEQALDAAYEVLGDLQQ